MANKHQVDGLWGQATYNGTQFFQWAHSRTPDGCVGYNTWFDAEWDLHANGHFIGIPSYKKFWYWETFAPPEYPDVKVVSEGQSGCWWYQYGTTWHTFQDASKDSRFCYMGDPYYGQVAIPPNFNQTEAW